MLAAALMLPSPAQAARRTEDPPTAPAAEHVWDLARTRLNDLAGPRSLPFGSTGGGPYRRTNAFAWTSGFFPSSLWLLYAHEKDVATLAKARHYTDLVLPVATWRGTHDLGFMVGLPAGLGAQLDPDSTRRARYRRAMSMAAASLSTRWNARVGALKSADYNGRWGVIIDSAMNAPMLVSTGAAISGRRGRVLANRGTRHLLTLAADFVRPDGSTFHRMAFNPRTGVLTGPIPGQGLSPSSTWSRGQAWAINGFAQGYVLTRDARLLDAARHTADFWISRVQSDFVPAWDLDVTDPHAPRDSSAAAITADGLLILSAAETDATRSSAYRSYALATLATLSTAPWVDEADSAVGLLQRQAYSVAIDPREGTYAWGDTYLLKALSTSG
jgi:unsaturated chondroitin disaccharide hydrolase